MELIERITKVLRGPSEEEMNRLARSLMGISETVTERVKKEGMPIFLMSKDVRRDN